MPDSAQAPDTVQTAPGTAPIPVELLQRIAAEKPDDPQVQRRCGELHFAARRMDLALECFRRTLELAPGDALAHYAIACTWQALHLPEEAERSYRAALAIQPDMVGALFNLGLLLWQELRRPDEAIPVLLKVLEAEPNHVEVHRCLGSAYFISERIDEAIASYRRYAALRPEIAIGHYELGCALSYGQFHKEAIPCFETAVRLDPLFADAYLKLGNAAFSAEGFEAAIPHYRRSHALRPLIKRSANQNPAAFSVLVLFAPGAANTPLDYLVGHSDYDIYIVQILPDMDYDIALLNRSADIALNVISDVDQGRDMLAIAGGITRQLTMPVVNPPEKIVPTGRESAFERLSGIPSCRVPAAKRYNGRELLSGNAEIAFPCLIRKAGTHNGYSFEYAMDAHHISQCVPEPGAEYYVIEYIDYQSADGHFRKYRFMFVGDDIFPYHLAIGDHWKVHHGTTHMADHPWMQREEEDFLNHPHNVFLPKHYEVLRTTRSIVGLDFFGIDCGLDREGNLVVFEVNATMLIHQHNAQFPYKIPHVERIKTAFDAMLRRAAQQSQKAAASA